MPDTTPVPIAIVMASFEPGGTERQMIELVRRLDPARWCVHVACFRARGGWFERVAESTARITEFPVRSFRRLDTLDCGRRFARWCRDRGIAVVHTSELASNLFALPSAALARVPVRIGSRREINPNKTVAAIALQRAAYAFAHVVIANSRAAAERLRREGVPARRIAVVPNGLDAEAIGVRTLRQPLRRVIVVANLRPEKQHDVLIDAAPHVLDRFPDARFDIVGDGPERTRLIARARALDVAHAFTFFGHCEDVPRQLTDSDIFVLPSRSEGFPNAVLEAMAAGLPVVASAIDGVRELIEPERTGLLVPPGNPRALGEALRRLMGDAALGARLGGQASTHTRAHYSFDRMVGEVESVYLRELGRGGARASRGVIDVSPH